MLLQYICIYTAPLFNIAANSKPIYYCQHSSSTDTSMALISDFIRLKILIGIWSCWWLLIDGKSVKVHLLVYDPFTESKLTAPWRVMFLPCIESINLGTHRNNPQFVRLLIPTKMGPTLLQCSKQNQFFLHFYCHWSHTLSIIGKCGSIGNSYAMQFSCDHSCHQSNSQLDEAGHCSKHQSIPKKEQGEANQLLNPIVLFNKIMAGETPASGTHSR